MLPVAVIIAAFLIIPVYYRLNVYTLYEYLGRRYNAAVRVAASLLFIAVRVGWLATAMYAPAP